MNEKTHKIIDDCDRKLDPNCKHELYHAGCWDGADKDGDWIFGTIYRCSKCKGYTHNRGK